SRTKTSPCWYGLMVPGSMFRYGSILTIVTWMPRASIRLPIEAALIPLPMLESTPPVTKMYFLLLAIDTPDFLQLLRRVDSDGDALRRREPDSDPTRGRPQLLDALGPLHRRGRERPDAEQGLPVVRVQSHMPSADERLAGRGSGLPTVGDGMTREIQRP